MISNFELRLRARKVLKGNWQIALMVALIASLPSLISQVVSIMTQTSSLDTLYTLLLAIQENPYVDVAALMDSLNFSWMVYAPSVVVTIVADLISPFLTLGMLNYMLRLLRGQEALISTVFSRASSFFKSIGLTIMVAIKTVLWCLPPMAVIILSILIPIDSVNLLMALSTILPIVMIVLCVRASLHYALATRIMADQPEKRIMQCIHESIDIMRNRKWQLFSLQLSFIGYSFGLMLVQYFLASIFGNVLASTVYMLLNLALTVYIHTAMCAFYEAHRVKQGDPLTDVEQQVV